MHDLLLMRGFDRVYDLFRHRQRFVKVQRTAQVLPFDIFHDEVVGANVVEVADIGVVQCGDGACLAAEALAERFFGNFDCDVAPQPRVARPVHLAHSAGANEREDLVRAEPRAGC